MNEQDFLEDLRVRANELLISGTEVAEVQAWVDSEKTTYYANVEKPQESQSQDTPATPESLVSGSGDGSSGLLTHNEEAAVGRATIGDAIGGIPGASQAYIGIAKLFGKEDAAIETAVGLASSTASLAEGVINAATSALFTVYDGISKLTSPEYREELASDPLARAQLYDSWAVDLDSGFEPLLNQTDQSFVEEFADGNFSQAGRQFAVGLAQAIPSLVAVYYGGGAGIYLLGASAAGNSFGETIYEAPESSTLSILGTSISKGVFEAVSEYVTKGLFGKAGRIFKVGGKEGLEAYAKSFFKEAFKGFNLEGASEAGASLAGHLLDSVVHNIDPPENLLYQLADEYIIGGTLGSVVSAAQTQVKPVIASKVEPQSKKVADQADQDSITTAVDGLKEAATQEEKSLLHNIIADGTKNLNDRQLAHEEIVNDMTPEEQADILDDVRTAEHYENAINNNPEIADETKALYEKTANDARIEAEGKYSTIETWDAVVADANTQKDEIKGKRKEIESKEKALKAAPNPNPATTEKLNQQKSELNEQEDAINDDLDSRRPTLTNKPTRDYIADLESNADKAHNQNLELLAERGGTPEEIGEEKADYKVKKAQLAKAKEKLEDLLVKRGLSREQATDELADIIKPTEQLIADTVNAETILTDTGLSDALVDGVVDLGLKPGSKVVADKVANSLTTTAEGVGTYLKTVVKSRDIPRAIDNLVQAIEARTDLTSEQKAQLKSDLELARPKLVVAGLGAIKSPLDDSGALETDTAVLEEDIDEGLAYFRDEIAGKVEAEVELEIDREGIEEDQQVAREAYQKQEDAIYDIIVSKEKGIGWAKKNSGMYKLIKAMGNGDARLAAKRINLILAEGLVGTDLKEERIEAGIAGKLQRKLGVLLKKSLEKLGAGTEYFDTSTTKIDETSEKAELTEEQRLGRARHHRLLQAGAALLELVGGGNGFIDYRRGHPSPKRNMSLRMYVHDIESLNDIGWTDSLNDLAQLQVGEETDLDGNVIGPVYAITIQSGWESATGDFAITINDGGSKPFEEAIGYREFQEELIAGERIEKYQDWNESEVITIKVADTEAFHQYARGAELENNKISTKTQSSKRPQAVDPNKPRSQWTTLKHSTGLEAIINASNDVVKLLTGEVTTFLGKNFSPKKLFETLNNAFGITYTIDKRSWDMFHVLRKHLYTYKDKNYKKAALNARVNEFSMIQDTAFEWINKPFNVLHNFDFRGRMYNSIKYLNFQGNKVAKALYRFGKKKTLGREGFKALVMQLGDYYGGDINIPGMKEAISSKSMTEKDRFRIGMHLVQKYADAAANPLKEVIVDGVKTFPNIEFLEEAGDKEDVISLATEMLKLTQHVNAGNSVESFKTNVIAWNDATISGAQNNGMLTRDTATLKYVNGLDTYQRGDLYLRVGREVFDGINKILGNPADYEWTTTDAANLKKFSDEIEVLEADLKDAWKDTDKRRIKAQIVKITEKPEFNAVAVKYWGDPVRQKFIRKLAKGPVMTAFYSAGSWVMGKDLVKTFGPETIKIDGKRIAPFKDTNQALAVWLTSRLRTATDNIAPGPALARKTFNSIAVAAAEGENGNFPGMQGVINDFPFLEEYVEHWDIKDAAGNKIHTATQFVNPGMSSLRFNKVINVGMRLGKIVKDFGKLRSASGANFTHHNDGQVAVSQYRNEAVAKRDVAFIHDNGGTHLPDAKAQVADIQEQMVKMYEGEPMHRLINQVLAHYPALAAAEIETYEAERNKMTDEFGKPIPRANVEDFTTNPYAFSSAGGLNRIDWTGAEIFYKKDGKLSDQETEFETKLQPRIENWNDINSELSVLNTPLMPKSTKGRVKVKPKTKKVKGKKVVDNDSVKPVVDTTPGVKVIAKPKDGVKKPKPVISRDDVVDVEVETPSAVDRASQITLTVDSKFENPAMQAKADRISEILNDPHTFKDKLAGRKRSKIDRATEEVLAATMLDFAVRGSELDENQLNTLIVQLETLVLEGKKSRKQQRKEQQAEETEIEKTVAEAIKTVSGIDPETVNKNVVKQKSSEFKGLRAWLKRGGLFISETNQDFYNLTSYLIPSGKGRAKMMEYLKAKLYTVLNDSYFWHGEDAKAIKATWEGIQAKHGVDTAWLSGKTKIAPSGIPLTRSGIARTYNHIRQGLFKQMIDGGVSEENMSEIIEYMEKNPKLKKFAEDIPQVFSGAKAIADMKTAKHGLKGFGSNELNIPKNPDHAAILERAYDGSIPEVAPWTPFKAEGTQSEINIEAMVQNNFGGLKTTLDSSLSDREGRGEYIFAGESVEQDINNYIAGPLRTINFLDFAVNAGAVFSSKNMLAGKAAFGDTWERVMKDSLERNLTGRNRKTPKHGAEKFFYNLLNQTSAGVLFLNTRSHVLQFISAINTAVDHPKTVALGAVRMDKQGEALNLITDSAWFSEERGKGGVSVEAAETFTESASWVGGKWLNTGLQKGYILTKYGDKGALLLGGVPYVAGRLAEGATPQEALKEFIFISEETQQSARPDRVGMDQVSMFGRLVMTFTSVAQAYARRAAREFQTLTSSDPEIGVATRAHAATKIYYYMYASSYLFSYLQEAAFLKFLDADEEDEEDLLKQGLSGKAFDNAISGRGPWGKVVVLSKTLLRIQQKYADNDWLREKKIADALVNFTPSVGTKARQISRSISGYYDQSDGYLGIINQDIVKGANAVAITGFPADRLLKKIEGISDLFADDLTAFEKLLRTLGWGRYELDKTVYKEGTTTQPLGEGEAIPESLMNN